MKKMPFGGGGAISDEQLRDGEQKLKRFGAFVELMSVQPVESAVLAVPQACSGRQAGSWLLCALRRSTPAAQAPVAAYDAAASSC